LRDKLNSLAICRSVKPLPLLKQNTSRLFWWGLVLLVISGLFIFIPAATSYY